MDERLSIRRKAGKSRAHTNARTEPVINAAVTVRRQKQPNRARKPREDIYTRRKQNPPASFSLADSRSYACASRVNGALCSNKIRVTR
jgi:hypothetical protein